ncbi:nuclear transport factor 2 family protein [Thermomonas aquatica]|nr:nuclear transport factor 2 family protein [Thermomonas aquatica]
MKLRPLAACLSIAFAALPPLAVSAQDAAPVAGAYTQAQAKQDIGKVVEAFRTAIIDKDKPKFLALFPANGPVAWQSVIGDDNLRHMRLNKPETGKARYNAKYSHLGFIDNIVSEQERSEETFDDIRIDTDGEVAAVSFDYRFLSDGKETNRGQESWSLVRTDEGWKIVSVVWSMHWPIKPAT